MFEFRALLPERLRQLEFEPGGGEIGLELFGAFAQPRDLRLRLAEALRLTVDLVLAFGERVAQPLGEGLRLGEARLHRLDVELGGRAAVAQGGDLRLQVRHQRFVGANFGERALQLVGGQGGDIALMLRFGPERHRIVLFRRQLGLQRLDSSLAPGDQFAGALNLAAQQVDLAAVLLALLPQRAVQALQRAMLLHLARQHRAALGERRACPLGLPENLVDADEDFDEFVAQPGQLVGPADDLNAALPDLLIDLGERVQLRGDRGRRRGGVRRRRGIERGGRRRGAAPEDMELQIAPGRLVVIDGVRARIVGRNAHFRTLKRTPSR